MKNVRFVPCGIGRAAITALIAILSGRVAPSLASTLPIAEGAYVAKSDSPCQAAAFADVMTYDGAGLGDPHASQCISTVLERRGRHYRVATTCRAMGDGTALSGPERTTQDIVVQSRTMMSVVTGGRRSTYALCPGYGHAP